MRAEHMWQAPCVHCTDFVGCFPHATTSSSELVWQHCRCAPFQEGSAASFWWSQYVDPHLQSMKFAYIYANLKVLRPYSLLFSRRCEDVSKGRFSSSVPPVSMQAKHILNSNNICSEYVCNSNCSHRSEIWQHPCSICSWFSTSKSVIAIPLWNAFPNKSLKRPETPW